MSHGGPWSQTPAMARVRPPGSARRIPERASSPARPVQSRIHGASACRVRPSSSKMTRARDPSPAVLPASRCTSRTRARRRTMAPAASAASSRTRSNTSRAIWKPLRPPGKCSARSALAPQRTVLPVDGRKPAVSMARRTPMRSRSLSRLGGSDSPSAGTAAGRVRSITAWPHDASRQATEAPAGPPPTTIASARQALRDASECAAGIVDTSEVGI